MDGRRHVRFDLSHRENLVVPWSVVCPGHILTVYSQLPAHVLAVYSMQGTSIVKEPLLGTTLQQPAHLVPTLLMVRINTGNLVCSQHANIY